MVRHEGAVPPGPNGRATAAHGLVIEAAHRRALFLPDVWEQLPEPNAFLDHLLVEAGLPVAGWPRAAAAWRFTTQRWHRRSR